MTFSRKAKREIFLILIFLTALPLLYAIIFGSGGMLQVQALRERVLNLQKQNQALAGEVRELEIKIEKVQSDPREVERIGREKHDLARPGDVIINLPSKEDEK